MVFDNKCSITKGVEYMSSPKIHYFLRPDLSTLPPIMTQLTTMNKFKYEIIFYSYALKKELIEYLNEMGIKVILNKEKEYRASNILQMVWKSNSFMNFSKKHLRGIPLDDIVWIGSADTAIWMGKNVRNRKFIYNIYELYDRFPLHLFMFKKYAQKATQVVVSERNRAYILRSWWKLDKTPIVIPNIPYYKESNVKYVIPEEVQRLINFGKKLFIYQGWIGKDRDITNFAKALQIIDNDDFYLVLMTPPNTEEIAKIKNLYSRTISIGYVSPPNHLEITRLGYIGIAMYDYSSLNNIFCAPNKIYEYSKFKVPIITNDLPGFIDTVGKSCAGVCVSFDNVSNVINSINEIHNNHIVYANNCEKLYNSANLLGIFEEILESVV